LTFSQEIQVESVNEIYEAKRTPLSEVSVAPATQNRLSPEEKDQLAAQYAGLVKHIAFRLAVTLPNRIEVEDLVHDGVIGLMEALNRFDPSKGVKFQTFAATRIRGAILDALRNLDWLSRGARHRSKEVHLAEEALGHEVGRKPTLEELSNHCGLSLVELQRRRFESELGFVASLDEVRTGTEDNDERLADKVADPSSDMDEFVERTHRREALRRGLETLRERERLVLALYYFEEMNIREIGKILGVSEPRVSQLLGRSIRKLKAFLEDLPGGKSGDIRPVI
jgi:RNA polymerase sigma factor for flagellar operon FliA